jgi:hypothetical protein
MVLLDVDWQGLSGTARSWLQGDWVSVACSTAPSCMTPASGTFNITSSMIGG